MNNNDIKIMLNAYNLKLDFYKPDNKRLYAIFDENDKQLSLRMNRKELIAFLEGFEVGITSLISHNK